LDQGHASPAQGKEAAPAAERASPKASSSPNGMAAPALSGAVIVTQATHNDIPDICALYKRVWDEYRGKIPDDLLKAWQPNPLEFTSWMEGVTYFAARRDRKLVGVMGCSLQDGAVRLVNLAVDPEFRRLGIAQQLVQASLEWARRGSASSVWVESLSRFDGAISLFQKLGFQACGVLHRHYWREDVTLLEHVL